MKAGLGAAAAGLLLMSANAVAAQPLRIMTLDQCADQYVLALAPDAELALSPRAQAPDSWMRDAARGHGAVRPTLEAAIGFGPDVVVRYWGGDQRMLEALERRGVRVITIPDQTEMSGVRDNIRAVAAGLNQSARGEALIARMDRQLARAKRPASPDRTALYLTAGGFTAGAGTLIDAIFRAAGFANLAGPGFAPVSVERIALQPPTRFVLGFFEQVRSDWRGPGRHPVVRKASQGRVAARLPAAALTCPAWFAADAAVMLAEQGQ